MPQTSRSSAAEVVRAFRVRVDHDAPVHQVAAASFVDAAFVALERWSPGHDADAVQMFVEDHESGERHCFTLHPASGEADSCD